MIVLNVVLIVAVIYLFICNRNLVSELRDARSRICDINKRSLAKPTISCPPSFLKPLDSASDKVVVKEVPRKEAVVKPPAKDVGPKSLVYYINLYNRALKDGDLQEIFFNEPGVQISHLSLQGEMDFLGFIEPESVHFKQNDKGWFIIVKTTTGHFAFPHFKLWGGVDPAKYAFKFTMNAGVGCIEKPASCRTDRDGWVLVEPGLLHYK